MNNSSKIEMNKKPQTSIKKNFVMNSLLTMSSIIFPIITFPYASRILLPEGTGRVAFATSVITYFNMFAQLGIPTYGIRTCAQCRDNKEQLSTVAKELLSINLILGIISSIAYIISVFLVPKFSQDKTLFLLMGITIFLNAIGMDWLFKGLEQYSYITKRSVFFKFIALLAMFMFVHKKSDYVIYGGITIFAASASNVMNFFYSRKFISFHTKAIHPTRHLKAIVVFFAMTVATTIYTNLDSVMLGFMTTQTDVGYYNAAVKVKTALMSFVTSLGAVLLPRASYYIENKQEEEFKRISTKALNFVIVIASSLTMYFALFAKQSILVLSGKAYYGAILPMQIIMPTLLFIGISNITGMQILIPLGKEKIVLYSEIAGAVTDLIINALLIPTFKSAGAAFGTLVAEFVVLLVQYVYLRKTVKPLLKKISYWKIVIALCLSGVTSLVVKNVQGGNLLILLISAMIFYGVYFLSLLIMKETFTIYLYNWVRKTITKKLSSKS
jgi:O-antigen/teichoic acid export membrane protein